MKGPVSVRMNPHLLEQLDAEAVADQRTRAQVVRIALADYLARQQQLRDTPPQEETQTAVG